jgi:isopentenyl-diphosphate delta-isomerase
MDIKKRKNDHLNLSLKKASQSAVSSLFEDVLLVPKTLPELNLSDINLNTEFLGRRISAPVIISSMTGGSERGKTLNRRLLAAAENENVPFALGSLKPVLKDQAMKETYLPKRDVSVPVFGNIGIDFLLEEVTAAELLQPVIEELKLAGLFVHLNIVQELIQQEGTQDFKGAIKAIRKLVDKMDVPVLVKEVGFGIDPATAAALGDCGVQALDVAGAGGTNFAAVEAARQNTTTPFDSWGIPTTLNLLMLKDKIKSPLIGSGGIADGLDAVKAIVLGADLVGVAKSILVAADQNTDGADIFLHNFCLTIKQTMLALGAEDLPALQEIQPIFKNTLYTALQQI